MSDRLSAMLIVSCIAAYFTMIFFNNITDFSTNEAFVKTVLGMEGIQAQGVLWRAITSPILILISHLTIIVIEAAIIGFCWMGVLLMGLGKNGKPFAEIGLMIAFCLFVGVFLVIGNEWFYMWQSPNLYNLSIKITGLSVLILLAKIYVSKVDI
jgi:predicted small integral membrane protein